MLTEDIPAVQYYQVTDEQLLFRLNTADVKTSYCFLSYTVSFSPEPESATLIQFDATERLFTFFEPEDLTVATLESPFYVNYTVTISAEQKEAETKTQSFVLNVTNPCANTDIS